MKRMRIIVSVAVMVFLVLSGCTYVYDNVTDRGADEGFYQGYPTVGDSDELSIVHPEAGSSLTGTELTVSSVIGATTYGVRIAETEAGLGTMNLYEKLDYATNILDISSAPLFHGLTYWWQARASMDNGITWGSWTPPASFATYFLDGERTATPSFEPAGGTYTSDQSVTISCATSGATIYYTTDGTDPVTSGTRQSGTSPVGPITAAIDPATTIRAIAMKAGYTNSEEGSAFYRVYVIGDTGPAGGIVFYDKGSYSDDWRWLEAAPASTEWTDVEWGEYGTTVGGTTDGNGEANTEAIVTALGPGTYAARLCYDLELNGYDDWYLPSFSELFSMYTNLYSEGIGDFIETEYWSSSEINENEAKGKFFKYGYSCFNLKNLGYCVRAARTF